MNNSTKQSLIQLVKSVAKDRMNVILTDAEAEKHLSQIVKNVQNEHANAVPSYYDVKEYFS
jgi:hypothetical protein